MSKRVTIMDLAKAAEVSVSTIDRILNKRGPVQRATAEHVLSVAEQIGFQGLPGLRRRLTEDAPERTFGFLLNRRERYLYGNFARALVHETTSSPRIKGKAIIRHLDDLSPEATATAILELAEECDAVGGVCVDHPRVNMAVADLRLRGVPFWAMLSDLTSTRRAGFVGANGWKLGRSAGWFMMRLCPPDSKIGVLVGSSRYLCQKEFESGFRGYLHEVAGRFQLLQTFETGEDDQMAEEIVSQMLNDNPDLGGIFMGGGGIDGVVAARRKAVGRRITVISTELSEATQGHLVDGMLDVALSHPFQDVARTAVRAMEASLGPKQPSSPLMHAVPMQIAISENF